MGGSSKQPEQPTPQTGGVQSVPAQYMAPRAVTYPAGMPGQNEAVAAQLAAGFGGAPADYAAQMAAIYQPKTLFELQQPLGVSRAQSAGKASTGNPVLDALLGIKAPAPAAPAATPAAQNQTQGSAAFGRVNPDRYSSGR